MRILLLNWRDARSPRGGGAERVTHEVARRLVARGHEVTWLSSAAPRLQSDEVLDGVRVVRRGSELTTRFHARQLARELSPDVVLEEINTLPYLAPLWSQAPVLLYMNQLARDVWWYEAPLPLAAVGWIAEPLYLQAYRHCAAVTISLSSRDDLRRIGISGPISIAPMVSDLPVAESVPKKALVGRMIAIGRLTPSKRYEHAVAALALVRNHLPEAALTIVGDGRSRESLAAAADKLGVTDAVRITGHVDDAEKLRLLDEADILVGTSVREGWGLTVTEAAARGTPAVVYNIPGFRDSVVHARTGLVVEPNPQALAASVAGLVQNPGMYDRLQVSAWRRVRSHTHDGTTDVFEAALLNAATS